MYEFYVYLATPNGFVSKKPYVGVTRITGLDPANAMKLVPPHTKLVKVSADTIDKAIEISRIKP